MGLLRSQLQKCSNWSKLLKRMNSCKLNLGIESEQVLIVPRNKGSPTRLVAKWFSSCKQLDSGNAVIFEEEGNQNGVHLAFQITMRHPSGSSYVFPLLFASQYGL